jgi:hypothetical protein
VSRSPVILFDIFVSTLIVYCSGQCVRSRKSLPSYCTVITRFSHYILYTYLKILFIIKKSFELQLNIQNFTNQNVFVKKLSIIFHTLLQLNVLIPFTYHRLPLFTKNESMYDT